MIKSIETYYKGYLCRSRTEARWMVAFDKAGIKYDYEPEGFDLGKAGKYLPDFYLPQFSTYAEVKGATFNPQEIQKAKALSVQSKKSVLFLTGQPSRKGYWSIYPMGKTGLEYSVKHNAELPHSLRSPLIGYSVDKTPIYKSEEDCFLLLLDLFNPNERLSLIKNEETLNNSYKNQEYLFPNAQSIEGIDESDSIAVRASRSARFENFKK